GQNGNWTILEDAYPSIGILRHLDNPLASIPPQPDTYLGPNWDATLGDVHRNDGVQNKWFYLLSQGGSGTNGNGFSYNLHGISLREALEIVVTSLRQELSLEDGYGEARSASVRAASALCGDYSTERIAVENAWQAVGVGPGFASAPSFSP